MKRITYTSLIIIFGLVVGFILLLVSGGYIIEGEVAMGIGLLWYYSLPAFLLLGYLTARVSYNWYSAQNVLLSQTAGLLGFALAIAILAPAATYLALWALSLW